MSANFVHGGRDRAPGITAEINTFENEFLWGDWYQHLISGLMIDGASRDTGNSGATHILRAGLLMGKVTSTNKLKPWDPTATTGEQRIFGILKESRSMLANNASTDRLTGPIICSGGVLSDKLIIAGTAGLGLASTAAYNYLARAQLRTNFKLSDEFHLNYPQYLIHDVTSAEQSGGITFSYADNFTEFQNTGGTLTFALASVAPYQGVEFRLRTETATTDAITLTSGSSNIKVPGASATNSLSVDASLIRVYGNGSLWCVETLIDTDT